MRGRPQADRDRPLSIPDPALVQAQGAQARAAELLRHLSAAAGEDLSTPRRRQLGGLLQRNTPAVVRMLSRALTQHKEAFAGLALEADGDALRAKQERADAWRHVRDLLQLCAEQAGDAYLREQAGAQETAAPAGAGAPARALAGDRCERGGDEAQAQRRAPPQGEERARRERLSRPARSFSATTFCPMAFQ